MKCFVFLCDGKGEVKVDCGFSLIYVMLGDVVWYYGDGGIVSRILVVCWLGWFSVEGC